MTWCERYRKNMPEVQLVLYSKNQTNFQEIASNDRAFEKQPKNTIITEKAVNIHR